MKLTQTEKVMIYAAALQGLVVSPGAVYTQDTYQEAALLLGNDLIKLIEAQGEHPNPHEPITD